MRRTRLPKNLEGNIDGKYSFGIDRFLKSTFRKKSSKDDLFFRQFCEVISVIKI